jgi:hypothetical protein
MVEIQRRNWPGLTTNEIRGLTVVRLASAFLGGTIEPPVAGSGRKSILHLDFLNAINGLIRSDLYLFESLVI